LISYKDNSTWETQRLNQAHAIGVTCISWAPTFPVANSNTQLARRFVSGGCDNLIKIWRFYDNENTWKVEETLSNHTDWVRDVAWAPNIGLPISTIASCSQDGNVIIWSSDNTSGWKKNPLPKFNDVVWRVSWSILGNILAVSGGDNKVSLWKESNNGEWKCTSVLEEDTTITTPNE